MVYVDALVENKLCIVGKGLLSIKIVLRFLHYAFGINVKINGHVRELNAIEVYLNGLVKMEYTCALGLHYHGKDKEDVDRNCWVKTHLDLVHKKNVDLRELVLH